MLSILGVIVILLIIAGLEIPRQYQKKKPRELISFLVLWFISGVYSLLIAADVNFTSPFELLSKYMPKLTSLLPFFNFLK